MKYIQKNQTNLTPYCTVEPLGKGYDIPSEAQLREAVKDTITVQSMGRLRNMRALAGKIGISTSGLYKWLSGKSSITYANLEKILIFLSENHD